MLPQKDVSLLPVLQPLNRAEIRRDHRDWYHSAKRLMSLTALEYLSVCGKDFFAVKATVYWICQVFGIIEFTCIHQLKLPFLLMGPTFDSVEAAAGTAGQQHVQQWSPQVFDDSQSR